MTPPVANLRVNQILDVSTELLRVRDSCVARRAIAPNPSLERTRPAHNFRSIIDLPGRSARFR